MIRYFWKIYAYVLFLIIYTENVGERMKQNFRFDISYDGTRYFGWEHQPDKDTIQGKLEQVVFRMLEEKVPISDIDIIGAGRTDAGVHAKGMVANVMLDTELSADEIMDYMNRYLPDDISVDMVTPVWPRFHARYNACGKTYRYTCNYGRGKTVFDRRYIVKLEKRPDVDAMRKAAKFLVGEHDFAAFCTNPKAKKSTVRKVTELEIVEKDNYIYFTVHGTGFLWNMVRVIVGTLLEVGYGRINADSIKDIIEAKDRKLAGPTAPAKGLCLMKVDYDK